MYLKLGVRLVNPSVSFCMDQRYSSQLILKSCQLGISTTCSYDVSSFNGLERQAIDLNGKAVMRFI
jgi:hypothetical protein